MMLEGRKIFANIPRFQRSPRSDPKATGFISNRRNFDNNNMAARPTTSHQVGKVIRKDDK